LWPLIGPVGISRTDLLDASSGELPMPRSLVQLADQTDTEGAA
jgi:hypothetical protein